jgi:receptor protein-tyrosine kinase
MAGAPPAIEQAAVQAAAQLGAQPGALPADSAAKVAEAPRLVREAPSRPQPIGISLLRQAGLAFVPDTAPRSRLSEELTLVQQQLLRAMAAPAQPGRPHVGRNAVLVTSARTGEGKSFVALNLAASIASSTSHQVVLVDVDGFGSSLTQGLSLAEAPGLRSLAANPSQPKEPLLRPTAIDRLSILPHGAPLPGNPAPPAGAAMAAAIRALAVAMPHHILVLDAPPALATSDANAIAPVVGQTVLVVQAEETPRDEVEAALDVVEACPSLHLLLNQTRFTASDSFGAYGAYGGTQGA